MTPQTASRKMVCGLCFSSIEKGGEYVYAPFNSSKIATVAAHLKCAKKEARKCPNCGAENLLKANFPLKCWKCGFIRKNGENPNTGHDSQENHMMVSDR